MHGTDSERARIAHHEAGHAVVALVNGFTLTHASIVAEGDVLGHVRHSWSGELLTQLHAEDLDLMNAIRAVEVIRAGRAAEERYLGNGRCVAWGEDGSQDDEDKALHLASRAAGHRDEVLALREFAGERAKSTVHLYWPAIERVAELLLKLGQELLREILKSTDLAPPEEEG